MKTYLFEKNDAPHIIPEDASAVIIGYQKWDDGELFIDIAKSHK